MSNAAQVFLLGNADAGALYVPFARDKLRALRLAGMTRAGKAYEINGAEILIKLAPEGDKIFVTVTEVCPDVVFSGLLDTYKARVRGPGHTPRYLINLQLASEHRLFYAGDGTPLPAKLFSGVRPIDQLAKLTTGLAGSDAPGEAAGVDGDIYTKTGTPDIWHKEAGSWVSVQDSSTKDPRLTNCLPIEATLLETDTYGVTTTTVDYSSFKEAYDRLLPTKFTGLLRQVVQATFATSAWTGFIPNKKGKTIAPVSYQFGNSWGCLKHLDKYYFVQITDSTIYYVPADYCVRTVKIGADTRKAAILKSLNIAEKVSIGVIPAGIGGSWDAEIGWAFSYDKLEASIVYTSTTAVGNTEYKTVSLLTITFSFDNKNKLTGATLKATEPHIFYNSLYFMNKKTGRSLFNSIEGGANKTIDFGVHTVGELAPANYEATNIPVYVYYTEAGIQVCGYSYLMQQPKIIAIPAPSAYLVNCSGWYSGVESPNQITSSSDFFAAGSYGTNTTAGYTAYSFGVNGNNTVSSVGAISINATKYQLGDATGSSPKSGFAAYSEAYTGTMVVFYPTAIPVTPPYTRGVDDVQGIFGNVYGQHAHVMSADCIGSVTVTTESRGTALADAVLTLSPLDRECALILSMVQSGGGTRTTDVQFGNATVHTAGDSKFFNYGMDANSSLMGEINWNRACVALSGGVGLATYPRTKMYRQDNGQAVGSAITFNPYAFATEIISTMDTTYSGPGACGNTPSYSVSSIGGAVHYSYTETTTEAAKNTTTLTLFGHNAPINMPVGAHVQELFLGIHPENDFKLSYTFMQAAFDPRNYICHKDDLESALVVQIGNQPQADIKNKLFGWLGVA